MTYDNQTNFEPADLAEGYTLLMEKMDSIRNSYRAKFNGLAEQANRTSDPGAKAIANAEKNAYRKAFMELAELYTLEQWIGQTINTERKKQVERKKQIRYIQDLVAHTPNDYLKNELQKLSEI